MATQQSYRLSDFDYSLPEDLIAQHPLASRSDSRLLHLPLGKGLPDGGGLTDGRPWFDRQFRDLPDLLQPGDLLVFNNSKVIPARLILEKPSGGAVEILIERILAPNRASAMMRANRKPANNTRLFKRSGAGIEAALIDIGLVIKGRDPNHDDRFLVESEQPLLDLLHEHGQLPLPPYIDHSPVEEDSRRYQTVYASSPGSVAAPTAGLHFDERLIEALGQRGVQTAQLTLHVGSGTFAPVKSEDLAEHRMHSEWCELPASTAMAIQEARARGGRIVAVGTTSLRTLESAFAMQLLADGRGLLRPGQWETNLFITPGFKFGLVDLLITNFHLPKSTLLMLVSAFSGYDRIRKAYAHAIEARYRFFSYGDAMLLERADANSDRQASNR